MNDSIPMPDQKELELRAYYLWENRGCPIGSPEVDWLLAERESQTRSEVDSTEKTQ
jgi:hypothetical protein